MDKGEAEESRKEGSSHQEEEVWEEPETGLNNGRVVVTNKEAK